MASPFFQKHYGDAAPRGEDGAWRRIDFDWLARPANLALRAGDYTNNVSLVLAFDHPESDKMLLFPGDAQVGNWLSWHTIEKWHLRDGADARPAARGERRADPDGEPAEPGRLLQGGPPRQPQRHRQGQGIGGDDPAGPRGLSSRSASRSPRT